MHQPPSKKRYVTLPVDLLTKMKIDIESTSGLVEEYLIDMRASSVAIAPEPIWMLKTHIDQRKDPEIDAQLPTAKRRTRVVVQMYAKLPTGVVCRVIPVIDDQVLPLMYAGMEKISLPNMPSFHFDRVHIISNRRLSGAIVGWAQEHMTAEEIADVATAPCVKEGTDFDQELPLRLKEDELALFSESEAEPAPQPIVEETTCE